MKTDRFVKVMLVIIAGLLFLNCVKDNGSGGVSDILGTKIKASVPAFMEQGKIYYCQSAGGHTYTVSSIDKESGWIRAKAKSSTFEAEGDVWVNTSLLYDCRESK
jgi:hypothetical protein